MINRLIPCLILILGISGCSTFVDYPIGVLERPKLIPITIEQLQQIPPDVLDIIAVNQAILQNHIKRYEGRIRTHDDSL